MEGKREKKEKKRGVETAGKNVRTERRIGGGWRGRRRIVRDSALVQSWSNYWHDLLGESSHLLGEGARANHIGGFGGRQVT